MLACPFGMSLAEELEGAASSYVSDLGWPVLALQPKDKVPVGGGGELRGVLKTSAAVERAWERTPSANIGVVLRETDFFVLDVDVRPDKGVDGGAKLRELEENFGELPVTPRAFTGSGKGSVHYYFKTPCVLETVTCTQLIDGTEPAGLDIKGLQKGYVILPPSLHNSGGIYRWGEERDPGEVPIADPPEWLVSLILQDREPSKRPRPVYEYQGPSIPIGFALGEKLMSQGRIKGYMHNGKWAVECADVHLHTARGAFDSYSCTVLFAPSPESPRGYLHCSHSSCRNGRQNSDNW